MSSSNLPEREERDDADPTYTHFGHRDEFMSLLSKFLAIDVYPHPSVTEDAAEAELVQKLGNILDYYLPLPGLLDPALDDIVPPLMASLSSALERLEASDTVAPSNRPNANSALAPPDAARLARIGRLINWVVKARGWKAIVPHFPSALHHLHTLIALLSAHGDSPHHPLLSTDDAWELRAILLLWLALLLTVPFNLAALGSEDTPTHLDVRAHERLFHVPTSDVAVRVTLLALPLLRRPGREGEYAALVLARLFARDDAVQGLPGFFSWARAELMEGERDAEASLVASLLTFLAVLPSMIAPSQLPLLSGFMDTELIPHLAGGNTAASSGLVRKLAVKARGRWWLARMAAKDVPDGLEDVLDDLMTALSDKDTIVRYSAAKYLARISALLPPDLAEQIVGATVELFAGTEDEPVVETAFSTIVDPGGSAAGGGTMGLGGLEATRGEARWHGVCLALAELARRGLLGPGDVAQTVPWAVKALTFDLRRGSHSIGSNVRDAASYVLWSLSRASSPEVLAPFAERMATAMVCAAVLDRAVGVRRAASAAFQEGVGRLGLYPEGIDVLGKTDFYSVSVRRKAFTIAAPAVATHRVYRDALRDHLHHITLRHWDSAMRTAAAAALLSLLQISQTDVPDAMAREMAQVAAVDTASTHGALVALTHIASLVDEGDKEKILASLSHVRPAALITTHAAEITAAGCTLLTATLTPAVDMAPAQRFLEAAARRREPEVHEALALACRRISEVRPASEVKTWMERCVADLSTARASQRQANALCLGHFVYKIGETGIAVEALLVLLDPQAKADVETRRNAIRSLADIGSQHSERKLLLEPSQTQRIVAALTSALEDYTTDQRGDVGSWIRAASIRALAKIISACAANEPLTRVPQDAFEAATAGIAKQAMEKLDVVRLASTKAWGVLLGANADSVWAWPDARCMEAEPMDNAQQNGHETEDEDVEGLKMRKPREWFTAGLELLRSPARTQIVAGLIQSVGSTVTATSDRAVTPFLQFMAANPEVHFAVLSDLAALLQANITANRVAVPILCTLARLFTVPSPQDVRDGQDDISALYLRLLMLATRGTATLKSLDRLSAALRVVIAALSLTFANVRLRAASAVPAFLGHRFPRLRGTTSEALYNLVSESGIEEDDDIVQREELEELLLETSWNDNEVKDEAARVGALMEGLVQRSPLGV